MTTISQKGPKMLALACGACLLLAAGSAVAEVPGVLGANVLSGVATGTAATDTVDISVTNQPFNGKYALAYPVMHSISIANEGAPCWVRVKSSLVEGGECRSDGAGDWVTCSDGWSYLVATLAENETVEYGEWIHAAACSSDKTVSEMIEIQAVQAFEFAPDFSSHDPWHGIEPQVCIRTRGGGYDE